LAGLVTAALLAFRGGGQPNPVSATPSPTARPLLSPFTGEPVPSLNRVLAVKIDNIVNARPQTGLTHADIVYVLPVEGGLSRFLAVFSSHYPSVVGPVRSAREDDLELLRQFGRPAFAYSGATATLLPYIQRTARIVNLYSGTTRGYYRDTSRAPPTICTLTPGSCWRRPRARAERATSGSGSARRRPAAGPLGRRQCPTRQPRSASPGRRIRDAGWWRWMAPRQRPLTAGGSHRPRW
jgi:hypothetical protein